MKTNNYNYAAILAGAALILAGCANEHSNPKAATTIPVQQAAVDEVTTDSTTRYSATIEPDSTVDMAFKVDGYVDSILKVNGRNIQSGDFVGQGAVLARVRQSDYRAGLDTSKSQALQASEALSVAQWQLAQAEAVHKKAVLDADRATALYREKALTKTDYDAALAQLDSTGAQVEAARKAIEAQRNALGAASAQERLAAITLEDTALVSPMAAIVLEKRIEPGSLASRGALAFRLGDVRTVRLAFGVPDTVVTDLKMGTSLPVQVDALPNCSFVGMIRQIAAGAEATTRLFRVEVAIPNPTQQLRTGMLGTVTVPGRQSGEVRPTVPAAALLRAPSDPNAASVFVIEHEGGITKAKLRTVRLGQFMGSRVTVLAGLLRGETVVTGGKQNLVDGAIIRVVE